jgi:ribosomal protein S18 acetylase RimI-like enzyme
MSELNGELSSTGGLSMPPLPAVARLANSWAPGDGDAGQAVVLTRPLSEAQWQKIRTFVGKTDRDDLRLRFGQALDFADDNTLKLFFDVGGACGEQVWALDDGDIAGILHRVRTSPSEAEIALIIRSDRKRRGFGEKLLRTALVRAVEQNLTTLRAYVLRENSAMLRLALKVGFMPRKATGFSVELEFNQRPAAVWAQIQGVKRAAAGRMTVIRRW